MRGDGLSYPVNPDAGGESAVYDWAGVAGRESSIAAAAAGPSNPYTHGQGRGGSGGALSYEQPYGHGERSFVEGVTDGLTQIASGTVGVSGAGRGLGGEDRFRLSRGSGGGGASGSGHGHGKGHDMV